MGCVRCGCGERGACADRPRVTQQTTTSQVSRFSLCGRLLRLHVVHSRLSETQLSDDSFPYMIVSEYGIAIDDTYLDPACPQTTLSWTHPSFAGDMDLYSHTAAALMRYRYGIGQVRCVHDLYLPAIVLQPRQSLE